MDEIVFDVDRRKHLLRISTPVPNTRIIMWVNYMHKIPE